jgi:RimJ/RimL family protein N-acetyltransferase
MDLLPVDIERFWADDELAHRDNCFYADAPQVALGIRMSDECVFDELGEEGTPWSHTPRERRLDLNRRYNDKSERIVGLRLLNESDMYFFPYWAEAFYASESYGKEEMAIPQKAEHYLYRLSSRKLYVLEDAGKPVSMAGLTREMRTAAGVAFVYTPAYFRQRGYATSIVAQISQLALDRGFKKCVLYTDLANPTSNSIYQKIGYKPICDSLQLKFE